MCDSGRSSHIQDQQYLAQSVQVMMSDMLRRAMKNAYNNLTNDLPSGSPSVLKEKQKPAKNLFELFSSKADNVPSKNSTELPPRKPMPSIFEIFPSQAAEIPVKNATQLLQEQEKHDDELLRHLDEAEKYFSNQSNSTTPNSMDFI